MYKLVLWDFDGTLANTHEDVWISLQYAARAFGGAIPRKVLTDASRLGAPMEELFRTVDPFPGDGKVAEFTDLVRSHYRNLNDHANTSFYPGILELMCRLRSIQIVNFIVTNKPRKSLERLLNIKGWANLFNGWITPDSVLGITLSKEQMIRMTLDRYMFDLSDCVFVGDTWSDIKAANVNHLDSIAVTYGDGDINRLKNEQPTYMADDAGRVSDILLGKATR